MFCFLSLSHGVSSQCPTRASQEGAASLRPVRPGPRRAQGSGLGEGRRQEPCPAECPRAPAGPGLPAGPRKAGNAAQARGPRPDPGAESPQRPRGGAALRRQPPLAPPAPPRPAAPPRTHLPTVWLASCFMRLNCFFMAAVGPGLSRRDAGQTGCGSTSLPGRRRRRRLPAWARPRASLPAAPPAGPGQLPAARPAHQLLPPAAPETRPPEVHPAGSPPCCKSAACGGCSITSSRRLVSLVQPPR